MMKMATVISIVIRQFTLTSYNLQGHILMHPIIKNTDVCVELPCS